MAHNNLIQERANSSCNFAIMSLLDANIESIPPNGDLPHG